MRLPAPPPAQAIQHAGAVLLQREIPDVVNVIFAKVRSSLVRLAISWRGLHHQGRDERIRWSRAPGSTPSIPLAVCAPLQLAQSARVPVILDAGGVDKPIGHDLLANITILSPNETELARLTGGGGTARAGSRLARLTGGGYRAGTQPGRRGRQGAPPHKARPPGAGGRLVPEAAGVQEPGGPHTARASLLARPRGQTPRAWRLQTRPRRGAQACRRGRRSRSWLLRRAWCTAG